MRIWSPKVETCSPHRERIGAGLSALPDAHDHPRTIPCTNARSHHCHHPCIALLTPFGMLSSRRATVVGMHRQACPRPASARTRVSDHGGHTSSTVAQAHVDRPRTSRSTPSRPEVASPQPLATASCGAATASPQPAAARRTPHSAATAVAVVSHTGSGPAATSPRPPRRRMTPSPGFLAAHGLATRAGIPAPQTPPQAAAATFEEGSHPARAHCPNTAMLGFTGIVCARLSTFLCVALMLSRRYCNVVSVPNPTP